MDNSNIPPGATTLERVVRFLRDAGGATNGKIAAIKLFGSRARGDASERSDFDVAVDAPDMDLAEWSAWAESVRDGIPTLCGIDLVRLSPELSDDLRKSILDEGVVIYERS